MARRVTQRIEDAVIVAIAGEAKRARAQAQLGIGKAATGCDKAVEQRCALQWLLIRERGALKVPKQPISLPEGVPKRHMDLVRPKPALQALFCKSLADRDLGLLSNTSSRVK